MKLLQADGESKGPKVQELSSMAVNKVMSPQKLRTSEVKSKISPQKGSSPKTNSEFLDEFQLQHVDLTQFEKKQGVAFPSLRQQEIRKDVIHSKKGSQGSDLLGLRSQKTSIVVMDKDQVVQNDGG